MSSKTSLWKRIINYPKQWQISTRLTLIYAAVVTILLGGACMASVIGIYYIINHYAETEMTISV